MHDEEWTIHFVWNILLRKTEWDHLDDFHEHPRQDFPVDARCTCITHNTT